MQDKLEKSCKSPHPWGPRTPGPSALCSPHPKRPCVGEERRACSGSNPLDWIPSRGVQGEPVQKILRSTYILAGQESSVTNAVSPCSSTTTIRGRDECPFGGEHSPSAVLTGVGGPPENHQCLAVYGVGGPHKTTAPNTSDHRVPAASAARARPS